MGGLLRVDRGRFDVIPVAAPDGGLPPLGVSVLGALWGGDPFNVALKLAPDRGGSSLVLLCSDLAAVRHGRREPGWGLTWVRPWDGCPLFGPLFWAVERVEPDGADLFPCSDAVLARLQEVLAVLGFRPR